MKLLMATLILMIGVIATVSSQQVKLNESTSTQPQVGERIPDFAMPSGTMENVSFDKITNEDLIGKTYLLAFYPADFSGGCTKEMCTFRDDFAGFNDLGVEVYPVSSDLVYAHHEFAKAHNLPFTLLSDYNSDFGKKMGVYLPDKGFLKRSVVVVNDEGIITYTDYDYSVADNADYDSLKSALEAEKK